jgi:hypothetical protein
VAALVNRAFATFQGLLDAMEKEIIAFERNGVKCEDLIGLGTSVNAHISAIEEALAEFETPSWEQWFSLLEPVSGDMALLKEKSLRKLGEACCKSADEECKKEVLKVLNRVKATKKMIAETLVTVTRDLAHR